MGDGGYGYALIITRNYEDIQIRYDVRMSKLPMTAFEPFRDTTPKDSAVHEHDVLLEMLAEATGSRGRAIETLKEVMSGKAIELRLSGLVSPQLKQRLCTSTA